MHSRTGEGCGNIQVGPGDPRGHRRQDEPAGTQVGSNHLRWCSKDTTQDVQKTQLRMFKTFPDFRDFVSNLAQPARAWANPLEIPPLESWGKEARWWWQEKNCSEKTNQSMIFRDEVFKLFNYIPDQSVVLWRGTQNLNTSNLLNYLKAKGVKSVCEVKLVLWYSSGADVLWSQLYGENDF